MLYPLKVRKITLLAGLFLCFLTTGFGQYKTYMLTQDGDTINAIDKQNRKQGIWIISVPELRGEPGYEEEGKFKDDKREGEWRRYNVNGDLVGVENYFLGGKHGIQRYFTMHGELIREESWKGYNPYAPYDTIPIYGEGNNEVLSYKIVKAEPYSIRHGDWKIYDPSSGRLVKKETYDHGALKKEAVDDLAVEDKPKPKVAKPKEVQAYEKKWSGKKRKDRDGATGL
jgi:hypothetical protein